MTAQKRQGRSPSAPSVSLQDAIENARKIHDGYMVSGVARDAIAQTLGYTPTSGKGARMIASLQSYGLLEKRSKGECGITGLAIKILLPDSEDEKREAVGIAFASPPVFSSLVKKFGGGIPQEPGVVSHLRRNGFGETSAKHTTRVFLASAAWISEQTDCERFGDSPESAENMAALPDQSKETIVHVEEKPMLPRTREPRFTDAFRVKIGGVEFRLMTSEPATAEQFGGFVKMAQMQQEFLEQKGSKQEYLPANA